MELLKENDPILREEMPLFDFSNPPVEPILFAKELARKLLELNGYSIAAPQLGMKHRVFAIKANPILVCYNPKVVDYSEEEIYLEEGCLSFPNLILKVKRPRVIKVRYTEPNGNVVTTKFQDLTARVFLHELDHLDGILYTDRATYFHLEQGRNKRRKSNKNGNR